MSQQFESRILPSTDTSYNAQCGSSNRFGSPQSAGKVEAVKKSRIPKKTQANTVWAENIWHEWATYRLKCLSQEERSCGHKLNVEITELEEVIDVRTPAIIGRSYTKTKPCRYWVMPLKGRWSPPYPATEKWSSIVNLRLCKGGLTYNFGPYDNRMK